MSLDEKITATFILEVIGKPAEHLTETLKNIIERMGKEKGVVVKNQKINKPAPMKKQKDFYTNFAEVELEIEGYLKLVLMVFGYMPAHVDIISPENIKLTNDGLTGILNELTRRLHGYDELARVIQMERKILERKLKALLEEKNKSGKKGEEKKK